MLDLLRAIAVFAKTVEAGSFRGAARRLALSPSVVSHHMTQLEIALGVSLLYRTTRQFSLTEHGKRLYDEARNMVAAAERGMAALSSDADDPSGQLRIAMPASLLSEDVYAGLAAFAAAFPRVGLAMHFSDVQIDIIGQGVDVALRAGAMKNSSLWSKKLYAFERTLVATPGYLAKQPIPRTPQALTASEWVRLSSRPPTATFVHRGRKQTIEFSSRLVVDSGVGLLQLACQGLGLAMVPAAMARADLASGRLVEVLPTWKLESLAVYAVWPAGVSSGLVQRLVAYLEHRDRIIDNIEQ